MLDQNHLHETGASEPGRSCHLLEQTRQVGTLRPRKWERLWVLCDEAFVAMSLHILCASGGQEQTTDKSTTVSFSVLPGACAQVSGQSVGARELVPCQEGVGMPLRKCFPQYLLIALFLTWLGGGTFTHLDTSRWG